MNYEIYSRLLLSRCRKAATPRNRRLILGLNPLALSASLIVKPCEVGCADAAGFNNDKGRNGVGMARRQRRQQLGLEGLWRLNQHDGLTCCFCRILPAIDRNHTR